MPTITLLDPKLDFVFKRLFTESPDLLTDLINAVRSTEPPVVELSILNPEIVPEELSGKHIVLDILAVDATGKRFNIEMQCNQHAGWEARSVYYLARSLGNQLQAGERYDRLQPVVGIHLMDFDLFPVPDQASWRFELRDRTYPDIMLDQCLELYMVEMPKADRLAGQTSSSSQLSRALAEWIVYFKHWREETMMQTIERPAIQKAYQHLHALSGDDLARHRAFVRERALRDAATERAYAIQKGIAIGEARGIARTLQRQLQAKFGALPASVEAQLHTADPAQLEQWAEHVLTAKTLDQLFNHH